MKRLLLFSETFGLWSSQVVYPSWHPAEPSWRVRKSEPNPSGHCRHWLFEMFMNSPSGQISIGAMNSMTVSVQHTAGVTTVKVRLIEDDSITMIVYSVFVSRLAKRASYPFWLECPDPPSKPRTATGLPSLVRSLTGEKTEGAHVTVIGLTVRVVLVTPYGLE